jgi:hypothetical protein
LNTPRVSELRADATPEAEPNVLAKVYRFILFERRRPSNKIGEPTSESGGRDAAATVRIKEVTVERAKGTTHPSNEAPRERPKEVNK